MKIDKAGKHKATDQINFVTNVAKNKSLTTGKLKQTEGWRKTTNML